MMHAIVTTRPNGHIILICINELNLNILFRMISMIQFHLVTRVLYKFLLMVLQIQIVVQALII